MMNMYCSPYFWDHSRFMPDIREKAVSISCCGADRVGTGLLDGVGAGATNARRISSVVAFRTKSSSFTMHRLKSWKYVTMIWPMAHEAKYIFICKILPSRNSRNRNEHPREGSEWVSWFAICLNKKNKEEKNDVASHKNLSVQSKGPCSESKIFAH